MLAGTVSDPTRGVLARASRPPGVGCFPGVETGITTIDANGNLTSKTDSTGNWTYEWNADNQLTRVTKDGTEVARFAHDPLGRRVEKVAGPVTTGWAYSGRDVVRESTTAGTSKYVSGDDRDEPLAREDASGNASYYHADGLGSITKTTDAVGTITLTKQYDAWGRFEQGVTVAGYGFTSREWDPETGLYYYRARYYDAHLGRFISEDPIRFSSGVNFYSYVLNNPTRFTDPAGLDIYNCQRPKRGIGGDWDSIPHGLYWSTTCKKSYSFGPATRIRAGGLYGEPSGVINPNDNPGFGPDGKATPPYQCSNINASKCFEDCICRKIEEHLKDPPVYNTSNNMCWDQRNTVRDDCKKECGGRIEPERP